MSEVKVNKISPRTNCGTVTLGDSGDTFSIPAGVTLTNSGTATGFGPTGAVSWDTTKKTTGFTAVSGVGYFCDTTSAAFTMTLPATPSAGDIVALKDYANTFDTNNLTVGRNGSNINGFAADAVISVQGQSLTLIYIDATQGWSAIYGATDADLPVPVFVAATGGTVTCCGDYKIHTFTGPGTFTVTSAGNPAGSSTVDYLVVAGGGGGGFNSTTTGRGGGGGAGGFRTNFPSPATTGLPVSVQGYPITVGSGGATASPGGSGNNSIFSTITSAGGGGGGAGPCSNRNGVPGGSGGGAATFNAAGTPGSGNTPPTSPPQGNNGGGGTEAAPVYGAGGGGGSGGVGTSGTSTQAGPGGNGTANSISGSSVTYAGGGGGASNSSSPTAGSGGPGGGGRGGNEAPPRTPAVAGGANTGGGGGGATDNSTGSGTGGSGIVVIRYKFQ